MPIQVLMPALSPTMEKGNLAKWLKKEGDKVKPGDGIAEFETDRATMEVEAADEGRIAKIRGTRGGWCRAVVGCRASVEKSVWPGGAGAASAPAKPPAAEAPAAKPAAAH